LVASSECEVEALYELAMMGMLPDVEKRLVKLEKEANMLHLCKNSRSLSPVWKMKLWLSLLRDISRNNNEF